MSKSSPLHLRVFVSSPSDVKDERQAALDLLCCITARLGLVGRVVVEPVLWDTPETPVPLEAGRGAQDLVNQYKGEAESFDLVIAVLSARIGSKSMMDDGSLIDSGTTYEIDKALAAKVPVWLYRNSQPLTLIPGESSAAMNRRFKQFKAVEAYFTEKFNIDSGRSIGAYSLYENISKFREILEAHLRQWIEQRSAIHGKPYCVPPPDTDRFIIGREDELRRLYNMVQQGNVCVLRAPGVGKTALVKTLVQDRQRMLRSFAGVFWLEFGQRPELQPQYTRWAEILNIPDDIHPTLGTEQAWKEEILSRMGSRRMLIVLDDVWDASQANDLIHRLPLSVFIITTRRNQEVAAELDDVTAERIIELDDLAEPDRLELLKRFAPQAIELLPDRTLQLVKRVGGLPQALKLIGKYLHRKSMTGSTAILNRAFDDLHQAEVLLQLKASSQPSPNGAAQTLDALVNLSFLALDSEDRRRSFISLAVFRPKPYYFTMNEAVQICKLHDPMADFEALSDLGLIDCRDDAFALHPILHGFAQRRLKQVPDLKAELENRLLDWYGEKIDIRRHSSVDDQYDLWYRYEHSEWQADVQNWLYYLAVSGDTAGSMLAFLRVYFDAWWWWGFFTPFKFCERLIQEWSQRSVGSEQRVGLQLLQDFQQNFAPGMDERGNVADWRRAQTALRSIRSSLDAHEPATRSRQLDARQVRALVDFALAECAAYGERNFGLAIDLIRESRREMMELGDTWSSTYLFYYEAKYHLSSGDASLALSTTQRGFELFNKQLNDPDPEAYANLWRIQAEAMLKIGEHEKSAHAWRKAAACAFAFQCLPESADEYTVGFFQHITRRFCSAVLTLAETDDARAKALATDMYELWTPWWRKYGSSEGSRLKRHIAGRDPGALRAAIFPPVPSIEPRENLVDFASNVSEVLEVIFKLADLSDFELRSRASSEGATPCSAPRWS